MIGLWALVAVAGATPTAGELTAWADTAFDVRPDLFEGRPVFTFGQRVGLSTDLGGGLRLTADGGLRARTPEGPFLVQGDLWRASMQHDGDHHRLEIGRLTRLDVRGWQRIDGLSATWRASEATDVDLWSGRLWSPTTWQVGDTVVAGGTVRWRPPGPAGPSRAVSLTAGAEARGAGEVVRGRMMGAVHARGPRGVRVAVVGEGELNSEHRVPLRLSSRAAGAVASGLVLDGELAWYGIDHAGTPEALDSPWDLLVADGYGLGGVGLTWRSDGWRIDGRGGVTLQVDADHPPQSGGHGRLGLGRDVAHGVVGAYAHGARIGTSWMAGGGVETDLSWDRLQLDVDSALYRFRPATGPASWVWEARAVGAVVVARGSTERRTHDVSVGWDVATGTDRLLRAWVRGGMVLRVRGGFAGGRT